MPGHKKMLSPDSLPARPALRRLAIFEAVARLGSIGAAAARIGLSQPAVTHALSRLEAEIGEQVLERGAGGSSATPAGQILYRRVERLLQRIEASLAGVTGLPERASARARNLTDAQIRCHLAIAEAGTFRAAAETLGIAQPTLQRAARSLEAALGVPLYQRRPHGIGAAPAGLQLAADLRLALQEIDQALDELDSARGGADGRISIGCLPLMPKTVLARAVGELLRIHPKVAISLDESSHARLMQSLSIGEIDMVLGALQSRRPLPGLRQRRLFADPYVVVVGAHHPLAVGAVPSDADLAAHPWVIPWRDTPRRAALETLFARLPKRPQVVMETSSLHMMRVILAESACLTILSRSQIDDGDLQGAVAVLPIPLMEQERFVGLTYRGDWLPTASQQRFMTVILRQSRDGNPALP